MSDGPTHKHKHKHKRTRPRRVPLQGRAEETVASIIEAAAQILEKEGFAGFNTNAVARRAGVSIGSLYQYFAGKDALTVALINREHKRFYEDAAVARSRRSGRAALETLLAAAVRQQLQRPMLARLLDLQEARPELRGDVEKDELDELFLEVLRRAAPKHQRLDVAAADVTAIIRGMVDSAGERGETDFDDLEQRLRAAVFGYLART